MALIASVAVDAATFAIDKLYDYAVPAALEAGAKPGVRVKVPFSRGNRQAEGFVFSVRALFTKTGNGMPRMTVAGNKRRIGLRLGPPIHTFP